MILHFQSTVTILRKLLKVHQAAVAKMFLPDPKTDVSESARHLYISVFVNFSIQKYHSHFERVLLVFDSHT